MLLLLTSQHVPCPLTVDDDYSRSALKAISMKVDQRAFQGLQCPRYRQDSHYLQLAGSRENMSLTISPGFMKIKRGQCHLRRIARKEFESRVAREAKER